MQTRTDDLTCFGKVPTHGDFVRDRSESDLVRAFDAWLQQGLYALKTRNSERYASYDRSLPLTFCFRSEPGTRVLIGAMQPSRDRVGRRYPFVVAREISLRDSARTSLLPVVEGRFLASAQQLAVQAGGGTIEYRDLTSLLSEIPTAPDAGSDAAYDRYLRETTFSSVVKHTWGYFEDSRKYLVFKNLMDAQEAHGSQRPASALRLPIGSGEGSEAHEAAFWLDVCDRLYGVDWDDAGFFWVSGRTEDEPGALLLFLKAPPSAAGFVALFPDADGAFADDDVLDTRESGRDRAVEAVLGLPSHYGEMLEDEELTLRGLLDRLQRNQ